MGRRRALRAPRRRARGRVDRTPAVAKRPPSGIFARPDTPRGRMSGLAHESVDGRLCDGAEERLADPLGVGPAARAPVGAVDAVLDAEDGVDARLRIDVATVDEHG